MTRFIRNRPLVGYVLVAAIAIAAAGGGLASGAGNAKAKTIRACADKQTGELRLARKCARTERRVSWSVRGPKGAKGAKGLRGAAGADGIAGATGATGETGPIGPSDAWEASSPGATNVTTTAKVLSVTVPAGSYVVDGKAQEQNRDTVNAAALHCNLSAGATLLDDMYSTALAYSAAVYGYGDAANVVHASFTTATGTTFTFSCVRQSGTSMYVNNPTLSAVKVGALH